LPGVSDTHWSAHGTTPSAIEAALRNMLKERHTENASFLPARALNLVCIVDKAWSGEIANRLRQVGRYHASRTVVCSVEPGRTTIDARATVASEADCVVTVLPASASFVPTPRETISAKPTLINGNIHRNGLR